jgi:hypothetical protein
MSLTVFLIGISILALAGIIWACSGYPESEKDFAIVFLMERRLRLRAYHALINDTEGPATESGVKRYRYSPELLALAQELDTPVQTGGAVRRIARMADSTSRCNKWREIAELLAECKVSQARVKQRLHDVVPKMKNLEGSPESSSGGYVELPE